MAKKWGNLVCCYVLFYFCSRSTAEDKSLGYSSLGCWSISGDFIPSVEDMDDELDGAYWDRVQPILKCARAAKDLGFNMLAVRDGGECLTSASVSQVYKKEGRSYECKNGEGGHDAMNVYEIIAELPEVVDFEGDMILSKVQKAMTMTSLHYDSDVASKGVWTKAEYEWPDRVIPYFIPPKLKNHQLEQKMLSGIRHWEEQTCVNFVPKKNHRDWVQLVREKNPLSRRCASAIGRNGRKQQMRLGDLCPAGSVIHEWGHSIGLWHTQSRPDRDDYVKIVWKNIVPGMSSQFKIYSHGMSDTLGVKYDYESIMHYGKDFFGKTSEDKSRILTTIETKEPKYQDVIGQRKYLSKGDLLLVNKMYGCPELRNYKMSKVNMTRHSDYKWYVKEWGKCSVTCGGGQRHRETFCAGKNGTEKVHHSNCTESPPDAWKNCNTQPCPSPYKWYVKKWQKCSVTCGGGYQRRVIVCATKAMLPTAWEMCNHTKTPVWQRKCNTQPCPKSTQWNVPEWKTSAWSRCSVTCGTGRQIRKIVCRAVKSGKRLRDMHCHAHRKPALVRLCSTGKKCPKRIRHVVCTDNNVMCHFWRKQNLCHRSNHVKRNCRRSCGTCKI